MMRSISKVAAVLALTMLSAPTVFAEAAPQTTRVQGTVSALTDSQIVLTKADGTTATIPLMATWMVGFNKPISIEAIQPGSYLGTTNYAKPDGTGTSLEVHAFPPGMKGPGVDYVMDANAGTTMTNGVVGTVVKSGDGRVLTVDYGRGVRTITVPAGVPIMMTTIVGHSAVKVGETVIVANIVRPQGPLQFISIEAGR